MKIVIFENEFVAIENTFRYLNKKKFGNKLIIDDYPRSQSISNTKKLLDYDLIIIDIDLSSKSELDGYGLIRKIESELGESSPPILILTGQEIPKDYANANNLSKEYDVLEKPINFNKLEVAISKFLPTSS